MFEGDSLDGGSSTSENELCPCLCMGGYVEFFQLAEGLAYIIYS